MVVKRNVHVLKGANMRALAYYGVQQGGNNVNKNTSEGDQLPRLQAAAEWGIKYIRLYAVNADLDVGDCITHVKRTLTRFPDDMKAVVCLTDTISSGFSVKNDIQYYTHQWGATVS